MIQYLLGKYKPAKTIEDQQSTEKLFNQEFKEQYGQEIYYFLNMKKESFAQELTKAKGFSYENIELLGNLFVHLGNNQFSESQKYLNKALELYEYINEVSKTFSLERANKINSIKSSEN